MLLKNIFDQKESFKITAEFLKPQGTSQRESTQKTFLALIEFTIFDIISLSNSTDNFHRLPSDDLKQIFELMVKKLKARWISKKNFHVELLI